MHSWNGEEGVVGGRVRLSHFTRCWSSFWVCWSWVFALLRHNLIRFKANYFLPECEHYTWKPEAGKSTACSSCVLHLSGKQSTFLPCRGVFACLESNRSCAHQYLRPSSACEGWGEGGHAGRQCRSWRGRAGSSPCPAWLSPLSYASRLLIGMNVLWNIYCPV